MCGTPVRDYRHKWKNLVQGQVPDGFPWDDMATTDHIVRKADKGTLERKNVRTACYKCNHTRGRSENEGSNFDINTKSSKFGLGKWQMNVRKFRVIEIYRDGQPSYVIKVVGTKIRQEHTLVP